MPFINGRYYMNPFYGAALERARAADAESEPRIDDGVFRYGGSEELDAQDNVYRYNPNAQTGGSEIELLAATRQRSTQHDIPAQKQTSQSKPEQSHPSHASPYVRVYPHERKVGGTPSWRNNNPANIMDGKFARAHGAIGRDQKGRAVFPTMKAGQDAQDALWGTKTYQSLTIEQAGKRWTHKDPPKVQKAYVAALSKGADAAADTPIWYLSPDQLEWLKQAQRHQEGFVAGITEPITHRP